MSAHYPLVLRPRLYRRLWGGTRLEGWLGGGQALSVSGPEHEPVGEAWLMDDASLVTNGASAGETLGAVAQRAGADLVGSAVFALHGARVPLLAKFLDAAADLSVQVHPDDAYAQRAHPGSGQLGKAEAWYLLEAAAGASVLRGFRHDVTPAQVRAAALDGTLPGLMQRLPVAPGSVIVNPAGTVHAVGAGCLLFEIQQASDITYRLYDHGRLGADGHPRELHLGDALAVADLSGGPAPTWPREALPDGWERLVALPQFTLDRLAVAGAATGRTSSESFELLVASEGALTLRAGAAEVALPRGAAAVLPAVLGEYELTGEGELLRSRVPA